MTWPEQHNDLARTTQWTGQNNTMTWPELEFDFFFFRFYQKICDLLMREKKSEWHYSVPMVTWKKRTTKILQDIILIVPNSLVNSKRKLAYFRRSISYTKRESKRRNRSGGVKNKRSLGQGDSIQTSLVFALPLLSRSLPLHSVLLTEHIV